MKCPYCNATNPEHATYCKSCGKALQSNMKKCPNGHDYDASLPACPHCPASRNQTFGALPTSRMGADSDRTRLDTGAPKLGSTGQAPAKPVVPGSADDRDKTVILRSDEHKENPPEGPLVDAKPHPQPMFKLVGWLVTFDLDPMGKDFRLEQGRHIIGRGPRCDIKFNVPGVSEEHAVLLCRNGKFIIEDMLSANGTFVNGEMIEDKVYLNENDIIRIATVDLKLKTV